ncbi:MAG: CTP synthase [Candidatus Gracilibacteria bacterium]
MKIIFITGGTVSGLGKGVTTASIGKLLQSSGLKVGVIKMDPYLQVDAGTMSPYEHGEVFVTEDGGETDLDLGNYERFLNIFLGKANNITTGKVYSNVIDKERAGGYLGKTVQIIPHITNEIKESIINIAKENDVTLVEVGGTVGDIESLPFLESIRQFKRDIGAENVFYIHITLLLKLDFSGEIKTKPIQHTVIKLREYGIQPNMLVCRTDGSISQKHIDKISMLCDLDPENIIEGKNVSTIYDVPEKFRNQNVDNIIMNHFGYKNKSSDLKKWNSLVGNIINPNKHITIGIVGKYTEFEDTYKSVIESLIHAGAFNDTKININWIDAEILENEFYSEKLDKFREDEKLDGILIPGGFGSRGIEGMINAVTYARTRNIPFLGICLGMQVAVIEYARNVLGIKDANSGEFNNKCKNKVINIMDSQKDIKNLGGTMRLGSYEAILTKGSLAEKLYNRNKISERHRHRYEVNVNYHNDLMKAGLSLSGLSPDKKLVEFVEINANNFFIATQAHPEFKSCLEKPHPLFLGLIKNSIK